MKVYQFIREEGGWKNWEMKPIEEYEWQNKTQATRRIKQLINTTITRALFKSRV